MRRHLLAGTVAAALVLTTVIGTAATAAADTAAPTDAAVTPAAPSAAQAAASSEGPGSKHPRARHERRRPGEEPHIVNLKFVEGTDVRLRGNRLVSQARGPIPQLDEVLARFPGTRVARLFDGTSEERHDQTRGEAIARDDAPQADLNLFFRLQTAATTDTVALMDALEGLDIVETAELAPLPVNPPVTPNYVPNQGYRNPATAGGIDADFANTQAGGKGEKVTITDIEYSWNRSHEDLSKARATGATIANGAPCDPFQSTNHGTAVLGEMVSDANGFGMSGLTPSASVHTVNAASLSGTDCLFSLANAINLAANNAAPGDVILIELQLAGPRWDGSNFGFVPVEWDLAIWSAIRQASSRGVIVVEAAGNGSQDLGDPIYNDANGKNWFSFDSGAIIVGAGNAPGCVWGGDPTVARGRLSFSNYGSRLNLQGWGDCVATTGYGDLQGGSNQNLWYTQQFNGTSSASPIVASAAAALSSVAEARGTTLTPSQVRSTLTSTGQAQAFGNPGKIGPLPNLRAAIGALGGVGPVAPVLTDGGHRIASGSLGTTTVPVSQTWTRNTTATLTFEVWLSKDGGSPTRVTLSAPTSPTATFQLERGHRYQFSARAKDAAGVWSARIYGATFQLAEYQENYSSTNPTYTGTWTRSAYTSSSDGYVKVSSAAGATAKFTFTGNSVGWVATKSTTRGQAKVYVDGVYKSTVDLYSTTPATKVVVYNTSWATSGTHTIEIRVVGTTGHPKVDVDAFVRTQ